jgi:hypothetical protein
MAAIWVAAARSEVRSDFATGKARDPGNSTRAWSKATERTALSRRERTDGNRLGEESSSALGQLQYVLIDAPLGPNVKRHEMNWSVAPFLELPCLPEHSTSLTTKPQKKR